MPEIKKDIVNSFLSRANQTLDFIPGYLANGDYFTAVNRSYYAAFYAIKALEINDGYDDYSKHAAVISCFRQFYIKTGIFPAEFSELIGMLSEDRTSGDYDVLSSFTGNEASAAYEASKTIVKKLCDHLA